MFRQIKEDEFQVLQQFAERDRPLEEGILYTSDYKGDAAVGLRALFEHNAR
jgi:hypothetical protein